MRPEEDSRDSVHPLRSLFDAAARGYAVRLACSRCRRAAVLDAHALWHAFRRKGWSQRLREVPRRCRCRGCGTRGPRLALVHEPATDRSLPMPPLHEWKAELRRHR